MKRVWRVVAWCGGGAVLSGGALLACVLADPPPLQQLPPPARPMIVHPSVSPPLGEVIGTPPTDTGPLQFVVPIQVDPGQSFQYRVFLDLNASTPPPPLVPSGSGVGGDDGGLATVTFSVKPDQLANPAACHVIDFVVADQFVSLQGATPKEPPGGDNAEWIYQPTGNCNFSDAGAAPVPEAGDGAAE